MKEKLGLTALPEEDLATIIPSAASSSLLSDASPKHGWRFEVVDMDKNRVDEIFARPIGTNIPND